MDYKCTLNSTFFVFIFVTSSVVMGALQRGRMITGDHFGFDETSNLLLDHKIVDVSISNTKTKQSIENIVPLMVALDNGTVIELNLKLTDGLLANDDTPIWDAMGRTFLSDNVMYTRNYEVMKDVGKFSFYQNYEYKAAATVFHDYNIIEGVIGYFAFKKNIICSTSIRSKSAQDDNMERNLNSTNSSTEGEPLLSHSEPNKTSNIVYPELFIILDRNYVRNGTRNAVQQALLYWNNVDMLYSDIKSPEIKITIAGIIIPMNEYATPWIYKANRNNGEYIDAYEAMHALDNHFFKHQRGFLNHSYDIVVGLVSTEMRLSNGERDLIGISFHDINCEVPRSRAVIATYINNSYRSGAHGLAHLFSAVDSEDTKACKEFGGIMAKNRTIRTSAASLLWSQCSRDSFSNYFKQEASQCLRNSPKTMQDQKENTTPASKSVCISNNISHQINNKNSRAVTGNACSTHKSTKEILFYSLLVCLYVWKNSIVLKSSSCT